MQCAAGAGPAFHGRPVGVVWPAWITLAGLAIAVAGVAPGCSSSAGTSQRTAGGEAAAEDDAGVDGIDPDTAIVVDDGRVEVCSPTGWTRGPQSRDHLVKYVPSRKKPYPSIVVMAADAPEGLDEIDAGTQKKFVAAIAASLAGTYSKDGKSTLVKQPAATRLGDHLGVTWSAPATIKVDGVRETIDRVSYAVVMGGRMYTVEARAPKGKLDAEGRASARAVAAALAPPAAEEAAPAEDPPGTDKPAADAPGGDAAAAAAANDAA